MEKLSDAAAIEDVQVKPRFNLGLCPALLLLLGACATPYQPSGMTGGYEEKKLGEGRYQLKFIGNGFTNPETVKQYWNKRAGELCNGRPFKDNAIAGYDQKTSMIILASGAYPTTDRYPTMTGTVECET